MDHKCYSSDLKGLRESKIFETDNIEQEKICATVSKTTQINCIMESKVKNILIWAIFVLKV